MYSYTGGTDDPLRHSSLRLTEEAILDMATTLINSNYEDCSLGGLNPFCKLNPVRESWTKGSSGVRPVIYWARLLGCEDMKAEDRTWVQIGLSLARKASLATDYEDSFLCNRLYVNPRSPQCLYKPEGIVRKGYIHHHSHIG